MVSVPQDHLLCPVEIHGPPGRIFGQIGCGMGLVIDLIHHINPKTVGNIVIFTVLGVMRRPDTVDVKLFHQ